MADVVSILDELQKKALKDEKLKTTAPRNQNRSRPAICLLQDLPESWLRIIRNGINCGRRSIPCRNERSTNGGGENSPMIEAEDDFYELFFANLEDH